MASRRIALCLEVTPKQTFASALDWPGWCRAGRDEGAALEALTSSAERYAPVAEQAGLSFPSTVAFDVVERVPGGPTTAFAAPECRRPFPQLTAEADRTKVTPAAARRLVGLVTAAWATFDKVAAASPAELRKGPRGGGRDRDKLIEHVIGAEAAYARKLGVKLKQPTIDETAAIEELRDPSPPWWVPLRTAHPSYLMAGPRATRPAGLRGTSSNMHGRCRTGRTARSSRWGGGLARPRRRTRPAGTRSRVAEPTMAWPTWVLAVAGRQQPRHSDEGI